mgnify:CR=1 FL=1
MKGKRNVKCIFSWYWWYGWVYAPLWSEHASDECGDGFPIKTLLTNIVGCFLIGIIVMLSGKYSKLSPEMTLMLKTGVCGGFTTFSTFALESVTLIQKGDILSGLLYIVFSVAGGMLAVVLTQFL